MGKDRLFEDPDMKQPFRFDERVAEVFDDMLDRSIPGYRDVIRITGELLAAFLEPYDRILDLGCSTGTTLLYLAERLTNLNPRLTGVDDSEAMIHRARTKTSAYNRKETCFQRADIRSFPIPEGTGAVLLQYTLQFLAPEDRLPLMVRIRQGLRRGGVLILSEKIRFDDAEIDRRFIETYHRFKETQGYSKLEIARKRDALENVLIPWTAAKNEQLLRDAGFRTVDSFFQWFNFRSWVAMM